MEKREVWMDGWGELSLFSSSRGRAGSPGRASLPANEDLPLILSPPSPSTHSPTPQFSAGKPSRSLQAAFRLLEDGRVKGVDHVEGGLFAWAGSGLPVEGEYDGSDAGRTPGVVQGQASWGRRK